jgi:hypothetical protein
MGGKAIEAQVGIFYIERRMGTGGIGIWSGVSGAADFFADATFPEFWPKIPTSSLPF